MMVKRLRGAQSSGTDTIPPRPSAAFGSRRDCVADLCDRSYSAFPPPGQETRGGRTQCAAGLQNPVSPLSAVTIDPLWQALFARLDRLPMEHAA